MPAPKEKPEATDLGQQLKMGGLLWERATTKPLEGDIQPQGPEGTKLVFHEPRGYERGQASQRWREAETIASVGRDQRQKLWDETLKLYREVPDLLTGEDNQQALELLRQAQDILLERPRQFDMAMFKVGQVQSLVSWRRNVNVWSNTYGWAIFAYEVLWIVALVGGIFGAPYVVDEVLRLAGGEPITGFVAGLWSTMMWGGLGGVVGAFYSLHKHVAQVRDFDRQYSMWYIVQPVMGMLLGTLVHLLTGAGFLTAQMGTDAEGRLIASFFRSAVACIAGFRQRSVLEIIDRVVQVITPSPPEKATTTNERPEEETSTQEASAESE
jgi:hypothetical protein